MPKAGNARHENGEQGPFQKDGTLMVACGAVVAGLQTQVAGAARWRRIGPIGLGARAGLTGWVGAGLNAS